MEIVIQRSYGSQGTNSRVLVNGEQVCYAIELPWVNNERQKSCIPEGSYQVIKRVSAKYGQHLHVQKVPNRALILIHPANNARTELRGCIAPVTKLEGEGRGSRSRLAFEKLCQLAFDAAAHGETITLTIQKQTV